MLRRPIAIADHGDATRDLHDVPDTGDGFRGGRIKAADLAAEHRAACHYRGQHPGYADIDAELRRAVHLEARIEAFRRFAGEVPVLRVFELHLGGDGQCRRPLRKRPIREPPVAGRMDHRSRFGAAARGLDTPRLRRRGDQDDPRARTRLAQWLPCRPHARAAARALHAEDLIDVGLVGRGELKPDLRPVRFELLGQ